MNVVVGEAVQHAAHDDVLGVRRAFVGRALGKEAPVERQREPEHLGAIVRELSARGGDQLRARGGRAVCQQQLAIENRRSDPRICVRARQQRRLQERAEAAQRR